MPANGIIRQSARKVTPLLKWERTQLRIHHAARRSSRWGWGRGWAQRSIAVCLAVCPSMGVAAVAALLHCTHTAKNVEFWRLRAPGVQQTVASWAGAKRCHDSSSSPYALTLSLSLSLCVLSLSRCSFALVSLPHLWLKDSADSDSVLISYPDPFALSSCLSLSRSSSTLPLAWVCKLFFVGTLWNAAPEASLVRACCSPVPQDAFCVWFQGQI